MYNDTVNLFQSRLIRECPNEGKVTKRDILQVIGVYQRRSSESVPGGRVTAGKSRR